MDQSTRIDQGSWRPQVAAFWAAVRVRTRLKLVAIPTWEKFHFSVKAGPSKGPALLSALSELGSLPGALIESIGVIGGTRLRENMETVLGLLPSLRFGGPFGVMKTEVGVNIRRIVGIEDKEGKTRVIAIGDYWSQTSLKPLHDWIFRILRRIHQDVTFSQGSFVDKVSTWGKGITLYSVDLTSATDRFPIDLICDVLEGVLPSTYVQAWRDVMVGYPFTTPSGKEVSYSVGNPMGFYSSWGSFALAHHFVVFWCCQDLGIPWGRAKYVMLGDDILIGDPRLGELYQSRILSLGIGISASKSYVSTEICEFAKRYLYLGKEVSPYPLSSLVPNLGDISLLVSAIMGEERKGFVPRSGVPESVGTLSRRLGRRGVFCRRAVERARDSELATLLFRSQISPTEFILRCSGAKTTEEFDFLHSMGVEILSVAVRSLVHKSLEAGDRSLEVQVYKDLFEAVSRLRRSGGTGREVMLLPLFALYSEFEEVVLRIHSEGFLYLSDGRLPDLGIIAEVVVDPLRESSWGMGRRERQVRAFSRLARACREAGSSLLAGGDLSIYGRFSPPMPMTQTLRYWVSKL